ncbi:MAG: hypothetical protein ABL962_03135 [Fimbriimonadaceae bacterium]
MDDIKKINDNEYEAIDPVTGGTWRVIAPHRLSPEGALLAITMKMEEENIRPEKGTTITIHFELRVAKEGEAPSKLPGSLKL